MSTPRSSQFAVAAQQIEGFLAAADAAAMRQARRAAARRRKRNPNSTFGQAARRIDAFLASWHSA